MNEALADRTGKEKKRERGVKSVLASVALWGTASSAVCRNSDFKRGSKELREKGGEGKRETTKCPGRGRMGSLGKRDEFASARDSERRGEGSQGNA